MRKRVVLMAAAIGAMGVAGTSWAQQATPGGGQNGGTAPGESVWQYGGRGSSGHHMRTMQVDPTGTSGLGYRLSGRIYGATRGPGANPIQPDIATPQPGSKAQAPVASGPQPALGHVPTDQQLARGAQPSIVDLGPVPRPELGGRKAGM